MQQVLESNSIYHVPLSAVFTLDFLYDLQNIIQCNVKNFIEKNIMSDETEEIKEEHQTDEEILAYAIQFK